MTKSAWQKRLEQLRNNYRPAETHQSIIGDGDAARAVIKAEAAVTALRAAAGRVHLGIANDEERQQVADAHAALEEAKRVAELSRMHLLFRAVPADVYEELVRSHPPTDKGAEVNEATFLPALMEACHRHLEPDGKGGWSESEGMSADDAAGLRTTLSPGDWDQLKVAVIAVNRQGRVQWEALGEASGPTGG